MFKSAKRHREKPLAELVEQCIAPSLATQGFANSDIIIAWPDIVGETLAAFSEPIKLEWPRRRAPADPDERPKPASLIIRAESAFALDIQHQSSVIIEKVNTYFGWKCVGKIVIKQGPIRRKERTTSQPIILAENDRHRIGNAVATVEDEGLRQALSQLGEHVLSANKKG